MKTRRETFEKSERLCSTKIISGLFENGVIFHNQLFKVVWSISPVQIPHPVQIALSVTKRGFRLAVTRNLIKRRMREAYRKNKHPLHEFLISQNKQVVLIVIMKGTVVPDYPAVEKSIKDLLDRLILQVKVKDEKIRIL